jgi:hypothetical protein
MGRKKYENQKQERKNVGRMQMLVIGHGDEKSGLEQGDVK